jgi:hypothetical protein
MKLKHSPKPWYTDKDKDFVFSGTNETHPDIVCRFFDRDESDYPNKEANAKLIAAAPELLEALQRALNDFKSQRWTEETYKVIEKAIKKAV